MSVLKTNIAKILIVLAVFVSLPIAVIVPRVIADTTTTQVTVSNSAPSFSIAPYESPASTATAPTSVGNTVTFYATATDSNGDAYRLVLCKTNAITANGVSDPICGGGSYCLSSSTTSGNQASCAYTALSGDPESNAWYAFVCDVVSGSACSSAAQGTGDAGSPFSVNHEPAFTAISENSALPGADVTFSATASDADVENIADQVRLVVCSTAGATADGCTVPANQLCISSYTATNPSCSYTLPSVRQDGNVTYYPYVFDSHNLGAANNPLASQQYTVLNSAPVVSDVVINGGNPISLTAGTTTNFTVTGTVTDINSCQDIANVRTSTYRSGVGYSACDEVSEQNYNYCYALVSCSVVGGTCSSASDGVSDYSCTVSMQFNADATTSGTLFPTENWLATLRAADSSLVGTAETVTGVEVNTLLALSLDALVAYGNVGAGTDTGATNATTTVSAVGNVGLDIEVSGTSMTNGTDTIPVANQKYSTASFTYSLAGTALSTTPTFVPLHVTKTTSYSTPASKLMYWGIAIPAGISMGTYTGTNTLTAILSDTVNW